MIWPRVKKGEEKGRTTTERKLLSNTQTCGKTSGEGGSKDLHLNSGLTCLSSLTSNGGKKPGERATLSDGGVGSTLLADLGGRGQIWGVLGTVIMPVHLKKHIMKKLCFMISFKKINCHIFYILYSLHVLLIFKSLAYSSRRSEIQYFEKYGAQVALKKASTDIRCLPDAREASDPGWGGQQLDCCSVVQNFLMKKKLTFSISFRDQWRAENLKSSMRLLQCQDLLFKNWLFYCKSVLCNNECDYFRL